MAADNSIRGFMAAQKQFALEEYHETLPPLDELIAQWKAKHGDRFADVSEAEIRAFSEEYYRRSSAELTVLLEHRKAQDEQEVTRLVGDHIVALCTQPTPPHELDPDHEMRELTRHHRWISPYVQSLARQQFAKIAERWEEIRPQIRARELTTLHQLLGSLTSSDEFAEEAWEVLGPQIQGAIRTVQANAELRERTKALAQKVERAIAPVLASHEAHELPPQGYIVVGLQLLRTMAQTAATVDQEHE